MITQYKLEQLQGRHSVRRYNSRPVSTEALDALRREVNEINAAYEGIRFGIVTDAPEAFASLIKSYGMFSGVRNYIVAVCDNTRDAEEMAGFAGQQLVMLAFSHGLGTCFVGGTYDLSAVRVTLEEEERVVFVIPFGYPDDSRPGFLGRMMMRMVPGKRLPVEAFYDENPGYFTLSQARERMPWLQDGLEAIAAAPSALNKQPVRVWLGIDMDIHAHLNLYNRYTDIDLGIAKFNFQAVVPGRWEWGHHGCFIPTRPYIQY